MPIYDLGCPTKLGDPHFGLHHSVLGCFLVTVCSQQQAHELQLLASSRYNLVIVDLTSADNYDVNLIDNDCCDNWTFSNAQSVNIFKPIVYQTLENWDQEGLASAHRLVPSLLDPRTAKEKSYLQMMLQWRSFVAWLMAWTRHIARYQAVAQLVPIAPEVFYDTVLEFDLKTKQILYLERDHTQADAAIRELIHANELLQPRYEKWKKDREFYI